MKRQGLLFLLLALSLLGSQAHAHLIGREAFSYPNGPIAGKTDGFGFDWLQANAFHSGTTSNWDTILASASVVSGKLHTGGSGISAAKREFNGPTNGSAIGQDERNGAYMGSHAVYFKVEMTRADGATWSGLSSYDFVNERILFGVPNSNGQFAIRVLNSGALDGATFSGVLANVDQTYVLVAKLDFERDLLALYVDPNLGAPEFANTPIVTRPYTGTNWSTAVRLGSDGNGETVWDDLAVADSWEDLYDPSTPDHLVTNDNDSGPGSLRQAINDAFSGDTIGFDPNVFNNRENIIPLQSNMLINKSLHIDASNIAGGVTLLGFSDSPPTFGGIFHLFGDVEISVRSLTFRDGRAGTGAGVAVDSGVTFSATNCLFDNNRATGRGGGVYSKSTLHLLNCTLTDNHSDVLGGAVHTEFQPSHTEIRHCTVTGNTAPDNGGAISGGVGSPVTYTILSSIVSNNTGSDLVAQAGSTISSEGGNIIGDADAAILDGFDQPNDMTGVTSLSLAPLAWNGGTTQTRLPLPGSIVIGKGRLSDTSPRSGAQGHSRWVGIDSGAAEIDWLYNVGGTQPTGLINDVTVPGDPVEPLPGFNSPIGEESFRVIDNNDSTKYLNFFINNTGFEVTPFPGETTLIGFSLTSANDVPARDPASFLIIGQKPGQADRIIASGKIPAFTSRFQKQEIFFSTTSEAFPKYAILFPSIIDPGDVSADSMQIAEVELYGYPVDRTPRITSFIYVRENGDWDLTWTSEPGKTYALEFSSNLDDWNRWRTGILATGYRHTFLGTDPIVQKRFQRVVEEEETP